MCRLSPLILMTLRPALANETISEKIGYFYVGIKVFLNACHQVIKLRAFYYFYGRVRKLLCSQVLNYSTKAKSTLFYTRINKKIVVPYNSFYKTFFLSMVKMLFAKCPCFKILRDYKMTLTYKGVCDLQ